MPIFQSRPDSHLIYLASPYSHPDPYVMAERYNHVKYATNYLLKQKQWVYSPIVHNHHLDNAGNSWAEWEDYDLTVLDRCDELWVLMLEGWKESIGVSAEIDFANMKPMSIRYMEPVVFDHVSDIMTIARRRQI
jgi:Domain of unknown function (DUF1937)